MVPSGTDDVREGTSALTALDALWVDSTGNPSVCVAVLDTPVDLSHPCFNGANLTQLETLTPGACNSGEALAHGTHVASIIFGQHDSPVRGIAPGCRGLIVPVFESGQGELLSPCSQLDLARAILLAVQHGANVINISGGQADASGKAHPLLASAVSLCADNGILIVAAAGNDGCDCLHVPAAEPSVLVVGAMDLQGSPMDFSNWGERYQAQGVLAPGENILGAVPGGLTALRTGTSFAASVVSGLVALVLSIQFKRGENPDPHAVRNAILSSAIGCDEKPVPNCRRLLAGRLNLVGALTHLKEGGIVKMSEQKAVAPDLNKGVEQNQTHMAASLKPGALATQLPTPGVQPAEFAGPASVEAAAASQPPTAANGQTLATAHFSAGVTPSGGGSGCACGGGAPPALVYALGQVGYDFGSESRRDSYLQHSGKNVLDPIQLLAHLQENPAEAAGIIWTLNLDATTIYVIQPVGPFAATGYERLREYLNAELNEGVERVSVPGYVAGKASLLNGQTVPVIFPEVRGMYSWSTRALVAAVLGETPKQKEQLALQQQKAEEIRNFLERVYYELRNLGLTSQERAINFAATNAFQVEHVYRNAIQTGFKLDSIDVERSPVCNPESDCWDVKLTFFNPGKRLEQARTVYRFTVDVSDTVPVTIGKVRNWHVY